MPIRMDRDGSVAVLTIDAVATRNALTGDLAAELLAALDSVEGDRTVGALVIRGAGGTFCSGADRTLLAAAAEQPLEPASVGALETIYECFLRIQSASVPTVAALRGAAVGAGVNLALAADVRIAATDFRFLSGFLRIGLHPGGGHFAMLERLVGPQTAVALSVLGQEVTGERLLSLGLAWELVADAEVEDRAIALARQVRDPDLARQAIASFRAQSSSRQLPMAVAMRAEQAAQLTSLARAAEGLRRVRR